MTAPTPAELRALADEREDQVAEAIANATQHAALGHLSDQQKWNEAAARFTVDAATFRAAADEQERLANELTRYAPMPPAPLRAGDYVDRASGSRHNGRIAMIFGDGYADIDWPPEPYPFHCPEPLDTLVPAANPPTIEETP